MISQVIEAGSALLHVRGEIVKAVRKDVPWAEMRALLKAEELCLKELKEHVRAQEASHGIP